MSVEWIADALKTFSGGQRGSDRNVELPQNSLTPSTLKSSRGLAPGSGQETVISHFLCARHCARGRISKVGKNKSLAPIEHLCHANLVTYIISFNPYNR